MGVFTKIGSGIKRFAQRSGSIIKEGVKKDAPVLMNIASKGTSLLSHLPGTIGTAAGLANKGINAIRGVIDQIPNNKARDTLNNVVNKGQNAVNRMEGGAQNIAQRAQGAAPLLNTVGKIAQTGARWAN